MMGADFFDMSAEIEKAKGLAPKPPVAEQRNRIERARKIMESYEHDGILIFGSSATNPEPVRYLANYIHVFPSASSQITSQVATLIAQPSDSNIHFEIFPFFTLKDISISSPQTSLCTVTCESASVTVPL